MTRSATVTIAGAGPAGLTAAINLANSGFRVVVHEQREDVGMRFHDDFQGLENWSRDDDVLDSLREMGVKPDFYCRPFHSGTIYGPTSEARIKSPNPLFYLVRRGRNRDSLDDSLKQQALNAGVRIKFNSAVDHREADIVATGPRRPWAVAVGLLFETNLPDTAAVLLNNALAPKGYSYLLVADGRATLATTLFERFALGKECLARTLQRFQELLGLEVRNARTFGGYAEFNLPKSATRDGRRYTGEAAGFQDGLFGFGIRYAMTSGYLAARSIIESADYNQLWRTRFGHQLRTSVVNRFWYELFGHTGYDLLVRRSGGSDNPGRFWTRVYNMSFCRMMLYPVALLVSRLRGRSSRP
jgi:flavin-dependent dehydrogenase